MVGLGGLEPPTSSLSGMRSSQLSYRPSERLWTPPASAADTGGAGRDRTGDLLSANQALSQLSYSPMKLSAPSFQPSAPTGLHARPEADR